jgi:hypothetical protein
MPIFEILSYIKNSITKSDPLNINEIIDDKKKKKLN